MPDSHLRNQCEACLVPPRAEDPVLAHLLNRISELEDENSNLRRLEETIRGNICLFDALLSRCDEGILLLSPELTILRLIHSVLGYSEQELLGENLLVFLHPDDVPPVEDAFSTLLRGHIETQIIDCRVRDSAGGWIGLEMQLTDLLDDPHVQAIVLHCRRCPPSCAAPEPPSRAPSQTVPSEA